MSRDVEFIMPSDIRNLRKNITDEGSYKMYGIGKSYDSRRFRQVQSKFCSEVENNSLLINDREIFEPLYYMIIKQATSKKISDELDNLVEKISEVLEELTQHEEVANFDSDYYFAFLRYVALIFVFIESTTSEKKGKGILEKEMNHETRNKLSEGVKDIIEIHTEIMKVFKIMVGKSNIVLVLKKDISLLKNFRRMMKSLLMSPMNYLKITGNSGMEGYHEVYKICIKEKIIETNDLIYDLAASLNDYEVTMKSIIYLMEAFGRNETHSDYDFFVACLTNFCTEHCMRKKGSKSDSSSVKNFKDFFMSMAQSFPDVFEANISEFLFFLDSRCYQFRNVLYEILKNILKSKYLEIADEDPNKENKLRKKNEFITFLIGDEEEKKPRTLDVTSFSRSYVLGVLNELFLLKKIDSDSRIHRIFNEEQIHYIFTLTSNRVQDKSSLVRRKALKLASDIMDFFNKEMKFAEYNSIEADLERVELEYESKRNDDRKNVYIQFKEFLKKCKAAFESMNKMLPLISKIINYQPESSDSLEAIKLLGKMNRLGLSTTEEFMPKLFSLIFIKDMNVKKEVLNAFLNIFIEGRRKINSVKKIAEYFSNSNLLAKRSIEKILCTLFEYSEKSKNEPDFKKKSFPELNHELVEFAWTQFSASFDFFIENKSQELKIETGSSYLTIFRIGLRVWPDLLDGKKTNTFIKKIVMANNKQILDWQNLHELSLIVMELSREEKNTKFCSILSKSLMKILTNNQGNDVFEWYSIARNIIIAIFKIFDIPMKPAEFFIRKLSEFITGEKVSSNDFYEGADSGIHTQIVNSHFKTGLLDTKKLSQLIYVVGEIVLNFTIFMEHIELETERLHKENRRIEDELAQATSGLDSTLNRQKQLIAEIHHTMVNDRGILPVFIPITLSLFHLICDNSIKEKEYGRGSFFHQVIVMTVCKYMIASKRLCNSEAEKVFKLMDSMISQSIKLNIIVCFSDLLRRYPSIIEKKIEYLFKCLKSTSFAVRKVALKLIIHLVLIDMIKIKQRVTDIIMMMDDPEKEISDLAKLFFLELHKKESQLIDKMIPDILSSMAKREEIDFDKFKNYTKHILGYIDKAKQANELAARMILRLSSSIGDNYRELVFSSICLNILMQENPNIFKKIYEDIDSIKIHFSIKKVRENFQEIISKAADYAERKKNVKSNMVKPVHVEAVNEKMRNYLEMGEEIQGIGSERIRKQPDKEIAEKRASGQMEEENLEDESQPRVRKIKKIRSRRKPSESDEDSDKENTQHRKVVRGLIRLRKGNKRARRSFFVEDDDDEVFERSGVMDEESEYDGEE